MHGIRVPTYTGNFGFRDKTKCLDRILGSQNQNACTFSQDETLSVKAKRP
jgi:hypothetical protein